MLFQQILNNSDSYSYKVYNELIDADIVISPAIYTDKNLMLLNNIPIFSTFYIRETYHKKYILVDYENAKYLNKFLQNQCIVIYDKNKDKIKDKNQYHTVIDITENAVKIIRERLYE